MHEEWMDKYWEQKLNASAALTAAEAAAAEARTRKEKATAARYSAEREYVYVRDGGVSTKLEIERFVIKWRDAEFELSDAVKSNDLVQQKLSCAHHTVNNANKTWKIILAGREVHSSCRDCLNLRGCNLDFVSNMCGNYNASSSGGGGLAGE